METRRLARMSLFSTDRRCQWSGPIVPVMAFKEKLLSSLPPVEAGTRLYKRYYVTSAGAVITPEVEKAALRLLPELVPEMDGTPPAGFVVVHRGGDGAAYL